MRSRTMASVLVSSMLAASPLLAQSAPPPGPPAPSAPPAAPPPAAPPPAAPAPAAPPPAGETKPSESGEAKPGDAKAEAKPGEAAPAESKPGDTKPGEGASGGEGASESGAAGAAQAGDPSSPSEPATGGEGAGPPGSAAPAPGPAVTAVEQPASDPKPKPEPGADAASSRLEVRHDVARDGGEKPKRERVNLPLTLEGRAGLVTRLSESAGAFDEEGLLDTSFGLGLWLEPSDEYSFGLELDHAGLGQGRDMSGPNSVDAEYSVTSLWLGTRVFPIRKRGLDVFVALRLGLGMQSLSATGTRDRLPTTAPARVFSCSEAAGPGFSLGGGLGMNLRVSRRVSFVPRIDAVGQQLSGEVLGSCAVGIGSVTAATASFGVAYDFDLEPGETRQQARR